MRPSLHQRRKERGEVVPCDDDGHPLYEIAVAPDLDTLTPCMPLAKHHVADRVELDRPSIVPARHENGCGVVSGGHLTCWVVGQVHESPRHHLIVYLCIANYISLTAVELPDLLPQTPYKDG